MSEEVAHTLQILLIYSLGRAAFSFVLHSCGQWVQFASLVCKVTKEEHVVVKVNHVTQAQLKKKHKRNKEKKPKGQPKNMSKIRKV